MQISRLLTAATFLCGVAVIAAGAGDEQRMPRLKVSAHVKNRGSAQGSAPQFVQNARFRERMWH